MKEDDAMVYRNPYLTSGASGFALNAISRDMKKELKVNLLLLLLLSAYYLQSIRVYIFLLLNVVELLMTFLMLFYMAEICGGNEDNTNR